MQVQLNQLTEDKISPRVEAQVYEEISDSEMETPAQEAAPRVAAASAIIPQYEDVVPVGGGSKSTDPYQITQCSAYVVN